MRSKPDYDKVCAECAHSDLPNRRGPVYVCTRARNLVTGEYPTAPVACVTMRSRGSPCGPEGRLYEARPAKAKPKKLESV
jgi:hypothetical protein